MLPGIRRWIPQIGKEEDSTHKPGCREKYYASDQNLEATEALEPFGLTIEKLGELYLETFRSLSRSPSQSESSTSADGLNHALRQAPLTS